MAARKKTSKSTKKTAKKTTKKAAKKSATKSPARKRATAAPLVLSIEERQRVPKPREGWQELVDRALDAWKAAPQLKVPGLSLTKLERLGEKAEKAADKERELAAKQARQLRPVSDSRLVKQGDVWRSILELNAAVKYHARQDPTLLQQFSFLTDALRSERSSSEDPPPT